MYIPNQKFLFLLKFPVVILIDMVHNVLVGYIGFSQLNSTIKKDCKHILFGFLAVDFLFTLFFTDPFLFYKIFTVVHFETLQ